MASDATVAGGARATDLALIRGLGFWALAASVINNTVGGGIFALPADMARTMGSAAPLAFVLGAIVFVPIALCFSAAGSRVHATGGAYSYVVTAFGELPGFLIAALLWISNVSADGGVAAALADQAKQVSPALASPWIRNGVIVAVFTILCLLNAYGVRAGARAVMVFAVAKLLPLFLLVALGWFWVHPANLHIAHVPAWSATGSSMVLVIFAYAGMETALLPSGEVSNPSRTVPRAAMTAIGFVVLLYVGLQVVAQGILGGELAKSSAPLASTAGAIAPWLFGVLLLTASISQFGYLQNDVLGSSRLLFAMARDGYLPSPLARITKGRRVPLLAVIAHAALACALGVTGSFPGLALLSGGEVCLVYLGVCAAAWWLQRKDIRGEGRPFMLRGGPLVPLIGCAGLALVLSTLHANEWLAIAYAMLAMIVVYALVRKWGQVHFPD